MMQLIHCSLLALSTRLKESDSFFVAICYKRKLLPHLVWAQLDNSTLIVFMAYKLLHRPIDKEQNIVSQAKRHLRMRNVAK